MPFTFSQTAGVLRSPDGQELYTGYSGRGEGCSHPAMQHVPMVGPLPQGLYSISPAFECTAPLPVGQVCPQCHGTTLHRHGPDVLRLTPVSAPDNPVYTSDQIQAIARLRAAGSLRPWMFGRTGFLIHGDNATHTASEGCVIAGYAARVLMHASPDKEVEVVA